MCTCVRASKTIVVFKPEKENEKKREKNTNSLAPCLFRDFFFCFSNIVIDQKISDSGFQALIKSQMCKRESKAQIYEIQSLLKKIAKLLFH